MMVIVIHLSLHLILNYQHLLIGVQKVIVVFQQTSSTLTMKAFIALCLLFVCVYSAPTFDAELDAAWNLFKHTYEKQYSFTEEINRRSIWEANVAIIRKHNLEADIGLHTYTLGMNKFGDMTNEEFSKQMNGLKLSLRNQSTAIDRHTFLAPANIKLPTSVDWRTKGYVTPVKDQGQCGSCWAFSTTGSLEGQHFAKTQQLVSLSEQNLVDCSTSFGNFGCRGGLMDNSFKYIKSNNGIDTEASYPYETKDDTCRFKAANVGATDTGFVDIPSKDETALQTAIATVGPISVAIDAAHSSFQLYKSGVYSETACSQTQLDHGVLAVGYDSLNGQDYYIVKNSWGLGWGNQGYIFMSRNKNNQCGISTMSSYPLV
jgi:cathepsin L